MEQTQEEIKGLELTPQNVESVSVVRSCRAIHFDVFSAQCAMYAGLKRFFTDGFVLLCKQWGRD